MNSFIVVLALVAAASAGPVFDLSAEFQQSKSPIGRIVGGENARITEVPYQVSLQLYGGHYCGASIVSDKWIITAAHCTEKPQHAYTIRAGSDFGDNGGSIHNIDRMIPHPFYKTAPSGVPYNDVALIRLIEPLNLDETRKPIKLYEQDEETEVGVMGTITGWGHTGEEYPDQLQIVHVPTVSKRDCYEAYKRYGGIPSGQICAAYPEGGKDSCQGDSGGPFVIGGRLAGIVSWGNGCAVKGFPGVYTEVAYHRDWIRETCGF